MSDDLYPVRLYWRAGRGGIARNGAKRVGLGLEHPPWAERLVLIDWAPAFFAEIQPERGGQRNMEAHEIAAARQLLEALTP